MTDTPNLVLVTIDSLRWDHYDFMGTDEELTPTMASLAADGLVFENAVSPGPSTLDAMPAIFAGEDVPDEPGTRGVDRRERFDHHMRARETLPERLQRHGYETGAFTANPWTSRYYGFDEGFDHFEDFMDVDREATAGEGGRLQSDSKLRYGARLLRHWSEEANMFQSWASFYDDAVAWTEQASEPYFLWLFLVDVHMPYLPPATYRTGSRLATYGANLWLYLNEHEPGAFESVWRGPLTRAYRDTIRYTDATLGRLVEDLADDDPTYVVHADHGEAFGDHDTYGHGATVYDHQIRTPVLVGNGPTGRVEEPFSLSRLPDLLEGLATGADVTALTEPVVRSRNRDPRFAVRGRDWKYVRTATDDELYDLRTGETDQLENDDLRRLGAALVDRWEETEAERTRIVQATKDLAADARL